MSKLWDLAHIRPSNRTMVEGETIPAMFWNAVAQRGPNTWLRQKELGIWRGWTWDQVGDGSVFNTQAAKGDLPEGIVHMDPGQVRAGLRWS